MHMQTIRVALVLEVDVLADYTPDDVCDRVIEVIEDWANDRYVPANLRITARLANTVYGPVDCTVRRDDTAA